VTNEAGEVGLLVRGHPKPYAPPFLMLGVDLENTTSDSFGISLSARYLAFDLPVSGSEVRVDGRAGSNPSLALQWYQPLGKSPLFFAPYAGVLGTKFNVVQDDKVVARYGQSLYKGGVDFGVNLGAFSDLRIGAYLGRLDADVEVGDPGLPAVAGKSAVTEMLWRFDGQDGAVVPSRGVFASARLGYTLVGPVIDPPLESGRTSNSLMQFETRGTDFHGVRGNDRVFVSWGFGTSFDNRPLPTDRFRLGQPFRLGAYRIGELNGDHYYAATAGYLYQLGRLPDFMGGSIYAGAWIENGDAFDDWNKASFRSQPGLGLVADTLIGPVLFGGTAGFDGRWTWYIAIGRIFR
jgi:NTE family protein